MALSTEKSEIIYFQLLKTNKMKSRGLGDDIAKFTKATGIKTIVDRVSEGLNINCGCNKQTRVV